MSAPSMDPELVNHFSVAIYPFLHNFSGRARGAHLERLAEHWRPWWTRFPEEELAAALEATMFFLPYVRNLLYPELAVLHHEPPGPQYRDWARHLREWTQPGLAAFCKRLPPAPVLRLTCAPALLRSLSSFHLGQHRPGCPALAGALDWIDVLLFPAGIGLLLLKFRVMDDRPTLAQLIELNLVMRLVHPPGIHWKMPVLHFPGGGDSGTLRDLMNRLTRGLVASGGETPYTDTEPGLTYGERCQLLSYACLQLSEAGRAALPAGVFASGEDRLLFEYAAGIRLGQSVHNPMWVPSPEQAERIRRDNRLALWRCWKGLALKEGCVFLGTEDLPFTRGSLARTIEADYLPLYLYTLYQKIQLMIFANDLMREVAAVESHLAGARALLRRFVAFRNRFWFSEVTRKPQGGDLYRLMQRSLEVPELYQMALASVKEAKEYYEERRDRQVRMGLTLLGLGGPLTALLGQVQPFVNAVYLWAAIVVLLVAAVLLWCLWRGRGRRKRRVRPRHDENEVLRMDIVVSAAAGDRRVA